MDLIISLEFANIFKSYEHDTLLWKAMNSRRRDMLKYLRAFFEVSVWLEDGAGVAWLP